MKVEVKTTNGNHIIENVWLVSIAVINGYQFLSIETLDSHVSFKMSEVLYFECVK